MLYWYLSVIMFFAPKIVDIFWGDIHFCTILFQNASIVINILRINSMYVLELYSFSYSWDTIFMLKDMYDIS